MKDHTSMHRQAKAEASRIADHAAASKGGPYIAANKIMARRATKGAKAALIAAMTVGALCERGRADAAEQLTKELAMLAAEH
ncbi:TPA: hypothetical protein ACXIDG_000918 [Pseudomonas aeruginosa]|uniref:hypothetical protein n=1 Tax=Pseudomonas aeruginosa TaxID=287 RepID=UPI000EB37683|nr:hypothetical protein [Pseudomonas aeruginosa]HBO2699826.1 hypothetical protein [Pseudomonas aeruginosa]